MKKILTAESVCQGHPDKLCDLISDSILDECLSLDKNSRVACETMATKGHIIVAGEITCSKKVNIRKVVYKVLEDVGYDRRKFLVYVYVHQQSKDIAAGVDNSIETRNDEEKNNDLGAGDQGTVYGYACRETYEMIPAPLFYAHEICHRLDLFRRSGEIKGIKPDGKAQVSIEYEDDKPVRVKSVIVSIQHDEDIDFDTLQRQINMHVFWPVFNSLKFDKDTEILINPSGKFTLGGPEADTGLTGRKIMVDTYGGLAPNGGGAFSGKDATKVDRSGAYMARYVAKNIVTAGFADKCQVSISYAIGKAEPVAVDIDCFGTQTIDIELLKKAVLDLYDLRPAAIIETLFLRSPGFSRTACYGHFGRNCFTWETVYDCNQLKEKVKEYEDREKESN